MPIHITHVPFAIDDAQTLAFVDHCLVNWNDLTVCSDADVDFMKHIVRRLFRLADAAVLMGILFEDATLAMLCAPNYQVFYVVERAETQGFKASIVVTEGFVASWSLRTGFYDGLSMVESAILDRENTGPAEDEK